MSKQEHAAKETNALPSHQLNITSQVLHWSPAVNAEQVASLTNSHAQLFEVVIASDCLFFKDFHADLLHTLQQLLVPGGVGLFLQPARDNTLHKFVALCAESGAFATEIIEDYSPQVVWSYLSGLLRFIQSFLDGQSQRYSSNYLILRQLTR